MHYMDEMDALARFVTAVRGGDKVPLSWVDELQDIETRGPVDHTPLGSATFHGRYDLARRLLEHGADPNTPYANNRTPLMGAVHRRDMDMVRLLLDAGADPNLGLPSLGYTPLHRAAHWDLLELAALLLDAGADVNGQTQAPNPEFCIKGESGGETALHYAAGSARIDVCAASAARRRSLCTHVRWAVPVDWAVRANRDEAFVHWLRSIAADELEPASPGCAVRT